jgi:HEAT repeat protein
LKAFSAGVDRSAGLRGVVFVSLMATGLLVVYGIFYLPARMAAARIFGSAGAQAAAALAAAAAAGALLLAAPWEGRFNGARGASDAALKAMLAADDAGDRAAGLAAIYRLGRDVGDFVDIRKTARSPDLRERYWLVRALDRSRKPGTLPVLVELLDDPQINVAYQACHAIGRRGDRRGIAPLLALIGRSREWYVQLYAYRALRRLEWRQSVSG